MATITSIILCSTCLLLFYKAALVLRIAYFTPVRRIPGPWYASLTNLRLKQAVLTGERIHYIHALHKQYGPIVRVSPTEIAVNDFAAFKEIHHMGSSFEKSPWYKNMNLIVGGPPGVFQENDIKLHAARRRLLARGFSKSYLRQEWEGVVRGKVQMAVEKLKEEARQQGYADAMKWWTFMATDVITYVAFGESFDTIQLGHKTPYFDAIDKANIGGVIRWELNWIYKVLQCVPLPSLQAIFHANDELLLWANKAIANSRAQDYGSSNVFATIINEAEKSDSALTDDDIRIEAGTLMAAGTDTIASTLTFFTWAVLRQPDLQRQLEDEAKTLPPDFKDADVEALPILNATLDETLRLYGAAPGAQPRIVPQKGATLGGYYIPEGVTVTTQAWSLHRDAQLFPDPEVFNHARWLPNNSSTMLDAAKAAYTPFGAGASMCIGLQLARMEMGLAAATFLRECRGARLSETMKPEDMEVENFFLIQPKGRKFEIKLA